MRRKERLKGKERDKEKQSSDSNDVSDLPDVPQDETSLNVDEEHNGAVSCVESGGETAEISRCGTPEIQDERFSSDHVSSVLQSDHYSSPDGEVKDVNDGTSSFTFEELKFSHRKLRSRKDIQPQPSMRWSDRQRFAVAESGVAVSRSESRHYGDDFDSSRSFNCSNRHVRMNGRLKFNCPNNKINKTHSCSCHQNNEYRVKVEPRVSAVRVSRESRSSSSLDMPKQFYRASKYGQMEYVREGCGRPKSKNVIVNNSSARELLNGKKVWDPMDSQKSYPRSNSDSDVTMKSSTSKINGPDSNASPKPNGDTSSLQVTKSSSAVDREENGDKYSILVTDENCQGCGREEEKEPCFSSDAVCEGGSSPVKNCLPSGTCDCGLDSTSSSDNCSSCPSEGDSSPSSSNVGTLESSSVSDSDDSNHQLERGETLQCVQNSSSTGSKIECTNRTEAGRKSEVPSDASSASLPTKTASGNGLPTVSVGSERPTIFASMPNQNLPFTMFQAPSSAMGYYHQNPPVSWTASPANGYLPYSHGNHYVYAGPLGYGFHGNPRLCVPYSPVQHLGTPLYNSGAVPVYQPGPKLKSDGQMQTPVVQEADSEPKSTLRCSSEVPLPGGGCRNDNSTKLQAKDSNFSLFHFGGPVELSTGRIPDSLPSKHKTDGALSSRVPGNQVEDDPPCDKETTMEEYNLFAASNGIRFSIF